MIYEDVKKVTISENQQRFYEEMHEDTVTATAACVVIGMPLLSCLQPGDEVFNAEVFDEIDNDVSSPGILLANFLLPPDNILDDIGFAKEGQPPLVKELDDIISFSNLTGAKLRVFVGNQPSGELLGTIEISKRVVFKRGDTDVNGVIEITDPVNLLGFLFLGDTQPRCFDASDFDDNGILDITDAIACLGFQFLGDPPPPAPGPFACGSDPTPDLQGADFGCTYPAESCQ